MSQETQNYYLTVSLGALLHDVGKFLQRSEIHIDNLESYKEEFCPFNKNKNCFTHLHSAYSAYFIEHIIPDGLLDKSELYNAARHHKKTPDDIYTRADWLTSDMERYAAEPDTEDFKEVLLHSVFDQVEVKYKIVHKGMFNSRWCYGRRELSPGGLFPKFCEEITDKSYKSLCNSFLKECSELKNISNLRCYFNELYYLLEKYTWCIPSATNVFPDVSLFDHLKSSASIANCLAHLKNETPIDKEKEFLLFAGDISGIQDYIFRITQAQGTGSVAKRLRGRSFFVSMFSEVLSRYIVESLGYFQPNINFCGGGNFEILLANTKETIEKLKEIEKEITDYLIEEYFGTIGFVCSYLPVSGDDLKKDFGKCKEKLEHLLSEAKLRKFYLYFKRTNNPVEEISSEQPLRICRSCNLQIVSKEDEICHQCKADKEIGQKLLRANYLVFSIGRKLNENGLLNFGKFGSVDLLEEIKDISIYDYVYYIGSNENGKTKAQYPLLKVVPSATAIIEDLKTEKEEDEESTVRVGQILSFSTIADMAEGDKKIAILKMDVDNLGLIFSIGFDVKLKEGKKIKTIARLSSLSRLITYFFTYIVEEACNEVFQNWLNETKWKHKDKISNIFYLVFSGGDDLFVVGPWDKIIDLAVLIRDKFKAYTCHNPNLSISAGVFICKPKFPITIAAKKVEEALKKAKNKKNSICVYGESVVWDVESEKSRAYQEELKEIYEGFQDWEILSERVYIKGKEDSQFMSMLTFKELKEFAEFLERHYESNDISRRFVHNLLVLNRTHFTKDFNERKKRWEEEHNQMIFPYLAYNLKRNIRSDYVREKLTEKLITSGKAISYVRQAGIPCQYFLMKTRK